MHILQVENLVVVPTVAYLYVLFFLFLLPKNTLVSDQSFCFLIVNIAPSIEVRSVLKPCFQGLSNDV